MSVEYYTEPPVSKLLASRTIAGSKQIAMDSRNRVAATYTLPTKMHLPGRVRAKRQVLPPQFLDYGSRVRRSHLVRVSMAAINEPNTDRRTNYARDNSTLDSASQRGYARILAPPPSSVNA